MLVEPLSRSHAKRPHHARSPDRVDECANGFVAHRLVVYTHGYCTLQACTELQHLSAASAEHRRGVGIPEE